MVVLTSFPPPQEGIQYRQPGTEAHVGARYLGVGTLYIAQSRLSWMGDNGQGFSLEYPGISLHAISRDLTNFPKDCLYLMVEGKLDAEDGNQPEQNAENSEEEEGEPRDFDSKPYTEVRFAPNDVTVLDSLYSAMCDCQALHPDSDASLSDQEEEYGGGDGDDDEETEVGGVQLTAQGRATLRHLESIFVVPGGSSGNQTNGQEPMDADEPGQFEDAD